eukprot:gene22129-23184_t
MKTVSAAEANRQFSKLLREVAAGETIEITSHGQPVAKISPPDEDHTVRQKLMDVAVDTNVITYAEGLGDADRILAATDVLLGLSGRIVLPTQVFGELYNVLIRKAKRSPSHALAALDLWKQDGRVVDVSVQAFWRATALATSHGLQIWDAVILAASEDADCEILLSEDMQHGFQWRRITVINPFVQPYHPLLASALFSRI